MSNKLPPIAQHFGQFMADQEAIQRAKKERKLPEGIQDKGLDRILSEQQIKETSLAYLLTDVIYQIMFQLCEQMQRGGMDLRHETKRRFNDLFKAAESFRDKAMRIAKDIELLDNDKVFDDYFQDADWMAEVIRILYQRACVSDDAKLRIRSLLFNLPQK